jgi:hypothetical protein
LTNIAKLAMKLATLAPLVAVTARHDLWAEGHKRCEVMLRTDPDAYYGGRGRLEEHRQRRADRAFQHKRADHLRALQFLGEDAIRAVRRFDRRYGNNALQLASQSATKLEEMLGRNRPYNDPFFRRDDHLLAVQKLRKSLLGLQKLRDRVL